ncbi:MAG: hypothetical protein SFU53_02120 [Terrimicrobiaceae bacterium]|nr:hypothetical protein [Terrimicrobiaceae bacterium]
MKSVRRLFWGTKPSPLPVHEQLELQLPASRLSRSDVEVLGELRRLREELAKG